VTHTWHISDSGRLVMHTTTLAGRGCMATGEATGEATGVGQREAVLGPFPSQELAQAVASALATAYEAGKADGREEIVVTARRTAREAGSSPTGGIGRGL
jgi:hypothetical protein